MNEPSQQTVPDNTDALFFDLGNAIASNTLGLKPRSREDVIRLGQKWFEAAMKSIKAQVCTDSVKALTVEHKDHTELAAAIADTLLACSFPSYIPLISVGRLCVHVGLHSICEWTS